ncbi:hypothetical protein ACHQM5_001846 [Ranunculus cassubicifolius]
MLSVEENDHIPEDTIENPEIGMTFNNIDDLANFYINYCNKKGFLVKRRSSKNGDNGEIRWVIYECARSGVPRSNSKNAFKMHPVSKTDCKARVSATLCKDGKWRFTKVALDHNHALSPSKS